MVIVQAQLACTRHECIKKAVFQYTKLYDNKLDVNRSEKP